MKVTTLAFLLPQFHPIPENDAWWGRGFTEWRNVTAARPRFLGHDQPRLPADLGFYDLRVPQTRHDQAELAAAHRVDAFVYYHYWFSGRRVLEQPLEGVLASGAPDHPFCICWANENWTRRWDGADEDVLLGQLYSDEDDEAHITSLLPILLDPRYVRVDGKPLVLVHRLDLLPDAPGMTARWQAAAVRAGLPGLHLAASQLIPQQQGDPRTRGFDSGVDFQPNFATMPNARPAWTAYKRLDPRQRTRKDHVLEYDDLVARMQSRPIPDYPQWPGVCPGWDNSPRRASGALIILGSTPDKYRAWVVETLRAERTRGRTSTLLFVNAWNEWAEGAVLEPDRRWGRGYLEAHRDAVSLIEQEG